MSLPVIFKKEKETMQNPLGASTKTGLVSTKEISCSVSI